MGYKYSGSNNIDEVAWYYDNSNGELHPVGKKKPNELGIYDMSGNVGEWCQDGRRIYTDEPQTNPIGTEGNVRALRGGDVIENNHNIFNFYRVSGRSGYNHAVADISPYYIFGFRLVLP